MRTPFRFPSSIERRARCLWSPRDPDTRHVPFVPPSRVITFVDSVARDEVTAVSAACLCSELPGKSSNRFDGTHQVEESRASANFRLQPVRIYASNLYSEFRARQLVKSSWWRLKIPVPLRSWKRDESVVADEQLDLTESEASIDREKRGYRKYFGDRRSSKK